MSDTSNEEPSETTRLMPSSTGQPRRDYIDMDEEANNREENGDLQVHVHKV